MFFDGCRFPMFKSGVCIATLVVVGGLVCPAALLPGCKAKPKDDPVAALKRFMVSVAIGDNDGVFKKLGPRTRSLLTKRARTASEQTGGAFKLKAVDLLTAGARSAAQADWTPKTYRVVDRSKGRVVVEVASPPPRHVMLDGGKVKMVFVAGLAPLPRAVPRPEFSRLEGFELLGLSVGVYLFGDTKGRIQVARKEKIEMVRYKGRWCVELGIAD